MEIKRVTPEKAKELLDSSSGYVYLDVRTAQEFDAGITTGTEDGHFRSLHARMKRQSGSGGKGGCGSVRT